MDYPRKEKCYWNLQLYPSKTGQSKIVRGLELRPRYQNSDMRCVLIPILRKILIWVLEIYKNEKRHYIYRLHKNIFTEMQMNIFKL
jgi:hypothetical protein